MKIRSSHFLINVLKKLGTTVIDICMEKESGIIIGKNVVYCFHLHDKGIIVFDHNFSIIGNFTLDGEYQPIKNVDALRKIMLMKGNIDKLIPTLVNYL